DNFVVRKPSGFEIGSTLYVQCRHAPLATARYEFSRVVRVSAADDHHGIDSIEQVFQGLLVLLGGMADRVGKSNFRVRIQPGDSRPDGSYVCRRRRRLADDAELDVGIAANFFRSLDHVEAAQVLDDALHLDVAVPAYQEDVEAFLLQLPGGVVSAIDERTGR